MTKVASSANIASNAAALLISIPFWESVGGGAKGGLNGSLDSRTAGSSCPALIGFWATHKTANCMYLGDACAFTYSCARPPKSLSSSAPRMPEWRNWYTHQTQNLARSHSCRFESDLRHHTFLDQIFAIFPSGVLLFQFFCSGGTWYPGNR